MAILDFLGDAFRSLFAKKVKPRPEPRTIEHRGMKAYFSTEMIEEFEKSGLDYERAFRESVDDVLDGEKDDMENPYR